MTPVLNIRSANPDRQLKRVKPPQIARNPNQPRKFFDPEAINQLAESIRQHGVLQPRSVQKTPSGYVLGAGERRLRAAGMAGLTKVP